MATEDARKLFVAGLPDTITEDVLRQLFEATGGTVVEVSIPRDRATGRPRGFGFVTLSTSEEASAARDSLDGSFQAGKSISVRPFQAEPPRREGDGPGPMQGGGGGGRGGPRPSAPMAPPAPDRTLYVGNLPYDCSQEEVEQLIGGTGAGPARINLPIDADGRKRGFGFVTMDTADSARVAMEALKGAEIRGRRLVINIAHPKGERPPRADGPGGGAPMRSGPRPGPGPGFGPPRGPSGFGGMAPPMDQPRRTFDERRRGGGGGGGEEGGIGGKRRGGGGRPERDRGRRADDWTDYDTDDDD